MTVSQQNETSRQIPAISLCLVVYKETDHLVKLFEGLSRQSRLDLIKEIVVVKNSDSVKTGAILQESLKTLSIPYKVVQNSENNIGLARRRTVELASSPYVLFVDPDCEVESEWVENLVNNWQELNSSQIVAVGGGNRISVHSCFSQSLELMLSNYVGHGRSPQAWLPSRPESVSHLPTTNALFCRASILRVGNFSADFVSVCEDVELSRRLKKESGELYLFPTPIVCNHHSENYSQWAQRMFRFAQGQVKVLALGSYRISAATLGSALLVALLLISVVFSFVWPVTLYFPSFYLATLAMISLYIGIRQKKPAYTLPTFFLFLLTHITYGFGTWAGLIFKECSTFKRISLERSPSR